WRGDRGDHAQRGARLPGGRPHRGPAPRPRHRRTPGALDQPGGNRRPDHRRARRPPSTGGLRVRLTSGQAADPSAPEPLPPPARSARPPGGDRGCHRRGRPPPPAGCRAPRPFDGERWPPVRLRPKPHRRGGWPRPPTSPEGIVDLITGELGHPAPPAAAPASGRRAARAAVRLCSQPRQPWAPWTTVAGQSTARRAGGAWIASPAPTRTVVPTTESLNVRAPHNLENRGRAGAALCRPLPS